MHKEHYYNLSVVWTGNTGSGTSAYKDFERSHTISVANKPDIFGSSDPGFRGDAAKYNPEDLLLASLTSCHMLWYLHLCAVNGIIVTDYKDQAEGIMEETSNGGGRFTSVTLNPEVTITDSTLVEKAIELHKKAHELCFIANSVNFPVDHKPTCKIQG